MKPKNLKLTADSQFEWTKRRIWIYATLLGTAAAMAYILWRGEDTALYRDAFNTLALLNASTLGSWVFGATWDDLNARKWGTPQPPEDSVPAPAREPSEE